MLNFQLTNIFSGKSCVNAISNLAQFREILSKCQTLTQRKARFMNRCRQQIHIVCKCNYRWKTISSKKQISISLRLNLSYNEVLKIMLPDVLEQKF